MYRLILLHLECHINYSVSSQMFKAQVKGVTVRSKFLLPCISAEISRSLELVSILESTQQSNKHFWLFSVKAKMSRSQFINGGESRVKKQNMESRPCSLQYIYFWIPPVCFCLFLGMHNRVRVKTNKKIKERKKKMTDYVSKWLSDQPSNWMSNSTNVWAGGLISWLTDSETADWLSEWLMSRWSFTGS